MKSPYENSLQKERVRLFCHVPLEDKLLIASVYPDHGIFEHLLSTLFNTIIQDLRTHGITHYTPDNRTRIDEFIRVRTNPQLTIARPVEAQPRGDEGVRHAPANPKVKSSNLSKSPKGRVRGE